MRARPLFHVLGMTRRRAVTVVLLAVAGGVVLAGGSMIQSSGTSGAQTPQRTPLWPPFTITYTVEGRDPITGRLVRDQSWRAVVTSEFSWRAELLRDGLNPERVGSTREVRGGVMHSYDAEQRVNRQLPLTSKDTVTDISAPELSPTLLPTVRAGAKPGWRLDAPRTPGRAAIVNSERVPCPTPRPPAGPCAAAGVTDVVREERVEYDPRSLSGEFIGGVGVFGEGRVNGQPFHTFRATAVEFQ